MATSSFLDLDDPFGPPARVTIVNDEHEFCEPLGAPPARKITPEEWEQWEARQAELAAQFGVGQPTISDIINLKTYRNVEK